MVDQGFSDLSAKSKLSSKNIIFLVILTLLVVGVIFVYDHWFGYKEYLPEKQSQKTSKIKTLEVSAWPEKEPSE
ncbi:MAG: hypothetical protein ABIG08_03300 [bacterium]